jgi:putative acetyltransferase
MTSQLIIRNETPADITAITSVTIAAFKTLEISNHTEQFIVETLRVAGALTVSLVAEQRGRVVGHIAFSPVTMSDGTTGWYGLGPVSVLPELQRTGIGKQLMNQGLARIRKLGAKGCCLVGHPDYYRKFGFENTPELGIEGVPPEVFMAVTFNGHTPKGTVAFHPAFFADKSPTQG